MNVITKRLEEVYKIKLSKAEKALRVPGSLTAKKLVDHHLGLQIEYDIYLNSIYRDLQQTIIPVDFREKLLIAEEFSAVMACVYEQYLPIPKERTRFRKNKDLFSKLLNPELQLEEPQPKRYELNHFTREGTRLSNFPRLLLLRLRRALSLVARLPVISHATGYIHAIEKMDAVTIPFINYLAWMFFVPRFTSQFGNLIINTVPTYWMSDEQRSLGIWLRLRMELGRRWFDIGNDGIACLVGLLNCFVLTGVLSPIGMYVTIAMFAYDVAAAFIRATIELSRLKNIQNGYLDLLRGAETPEDKNMIKAELDHICKLMQHEYKRMALLITVTSVLLGGMIFIAPFLAAGPWFLVTSAAIIVAITIFNYGMTQYLDKTKPSVNVAELEKAHTKASERGFFAHRHLAECTPHSSFPEIDLITNDVESVSMVSAYAQVR